MTLKVLTIGTFDIPHIGHASFLLRAALLGDLTVGVNSDRFAESFKGEAPFFDEDERMDLIKHLGYPVRLNDGPGVELIEEMDPHLIAIGTDWLPKNYMAQIGVTREFLEERGHGIVFIPYTTGISTTEIRKRLLER